MQRKIFAACQTEQMVLDIFARMKILLATKLGQFYLLHIENSLYGSMLYFQKVVHNYF